MSVLAALGRGSGSFDSSQTVAREGHAAEIAFEQRLGEAWGSLRKEHACTHGCAHAFLCGIEDLEEGWV